MRIARLAVSLSFCLAGFAAGQPASSPRVGIYHCTNGFTLTISKCDKWNGANDHYAELA